MGSTALTGMLEIADRSVALKWHLQSNHFPPVSLDFMGVAETAIEDVDCGHGGNEILMPNGRTLTASAIVDGLHLEQFLDQSDYEDSGVDLGLGEDE